MKSITIRFLAPVNQQTVNSLISVVEQNINQGVEKVKLLISSPGGDVTSGIAAYNFLKGSPMISTISPFSILISSIIGSNVVFISS